MKKLWIASMLLRTICFIFPALNRERDELLALLDVNDRQKYARDHTYLDESATYNEFTTAEVGYQDGCFI